MAGAVAPVSIFTDLDPLGAVPLSLGSVGTAVAFFGQGECSARLIINSPVAVVVEVIADFCFGGYSAVAGASPLSAAADFCPVGTLAAPSSFERTAITGTGRAGSAGTADVIFVDSSVAIVVFFIAEFRSWGDLISAESAPPTIYTLFPSGSANSAIFGPRWTGVAVPLYRLSGPLDVVDLAVAVVIFSIADLFCGEEELFADKILSDTGIESSTASTFSFIIQTGLAQKTDIIGDSIAVFVFTVIAEFSLGEDLIIAFL